MTIEVRKYSSVQAEALRALERVAAKHTAARTRVLAAFAGQAAYEDDGRGSAGAWLRWHTRVTKGAAAGAVGWVRRLAAHPVVADALTAVLEALGKRTGPEDLRTAAQRRHDALEEACRRLVASGMLPGRAGQPTQVQVHVTLSQLRGLPGAPAAEDAWAAARACQPGWLTGPEADAAACDATVVPIVTGHVDPAAVDQLAGIHLAAPLTAATRQRLRRTLLRLAADALSGPGGLAAQLRAGVAGAPLASVSLPLDVGPAAETIPAHLRRAVTTRHPHCAFPGCGQPASVCEIHHIVPRSRGGPTSLANLVTMCVFHHLTVVHRWGWDLRLNSDGTTTATSPHGQVLHSHGPPRQAA